MTDSQPATLIVLQPALDDREPLAKPLDGTDSFSPDSYSADSCCGGGICSI
jgi:hypothetical protein